jgi:hypothetical protein
MQAVSSTSGKSSNEPASNTSVISDVKINHINSTSQGNSEKVIGSWEEYEASKMPLIAAIPEKGIYLYDTKKDQLILKVGENEHYYSWAWMTPRFILPEIRLSDYDADGKDELSVILYIGSGTGVSVEELHIIEIPEEGIITDKQSSSANSDYFKDQIFKDYSSQLNKAVHFKTFMNTGKLMGRITIGTKTYTIDLKELQSKEYGKIGNSINFDNIVGFSSDNNKLTAEFGFGVTSKNIASPNYIGNINADVVYKNGTFKLSSLKFNKNVQ